MSTGKAVIAVIDDEESICKGLERLLRSAGLTAKTFLNGADFLRFLETDRPDCVVLDLNMMPMNGLAVLEHLAMRRPKLPVIVMTGNDSEEACELAMSHDIVAYLYKPVDAGVLLDAIDEAVGESSQAFDS